MRYLAVILVLILTATLPAHTLWLFSSSYIIDMQGEDHDTPHPFSILYGWGHSMPVDDQLTRAQVDRMLICGPDGVVTPLEPGPQGGYLATQIAPTVAGRYVAGAALKPYIYTSFHDGDRTKFLLVGKDGIPEGVEVITSRRTNQFAKTVVSVGDTTGMPADQEMGLELEVILLADPTTMVAGSTMPFLVKFRNEPLPVKTYSVTVKMTRLGFTGDTEITLGNDGKGSAILPDTGVYQIAVALEEAVSAEELQDIDGVRYSSTTTFACTAGLSHD